MKKVFSVLLFVFAAICVQAQAEINGCDIVVVYGNETSYFEAYGNVFVVTNPKEHADLDVKIVDSPRFATYKVFTTTDTPKKCGEWRFVSDRSQAKFTIRYVKELEECSIYFTKNRSEAGWF